VRMSISPAGAESVLLLSRERRKEYY